MEGLRFDEIVYFVSAFKNKNAVIYDLVDEKYEYTYNEAGYPETATYYLEGELDSELEFIYESL